MKTLRQARKAKGYTLKQLSSVTNNTIPHLSWIETGKVLPSLITRKWLEQVLGEKINWLDGSINTEPRNPPSDWNSTEREFRYLIPMIASLPDSEKQIFIETMIKHLNKLKT